MRKILVFGATSAIASETARCFAKEGDSFVLLGRAQQRLSVVADDLRAHGACEVKTLVAELDSSDSHTELFSRLDDMIDYDMALIAYGSLSDQKACEKSYAETYQSLKVNFLSVVSLLTRLANKMEDAQRGTIVVISSVAGERGRQSNYVYGTAKGALNVFLQGLRHRLSKSGVAVVTVKPGFVDTPMTAHLNKGLLFVGPDVVGRSIYKAVLRGKNEVYTPGFWRVIMAIIRALPDALFNRTSL